MNKKFAFTLSEVLVTMSIIGVISALTVPTLVNSYQKKAQAVQLRKVVSDISNAVDMAITEEGKTKFSATKYFDNSDLFVTEKLKTIKTCEKNDDNDETGECFASEAYRSIDGTTSKSFSCGGNSYVLANSAAVCLKYYKPGLIPYVSVNVDVNGKEGPNVGGRDMYGFYITQEGEISVKPDGTEGTYTTNDCTKDPVGLACYQIITEANWKMDY